MTILLAVVSLALMAFSVSTLLALRAVVSYRVERPVPVTEPSSTGVDEEKLNVVLIEINARIDSLKLAVADGIERVARAENRISKTVTSARRLVRENGLEHAGIEAEFEELQPANGEAVEPLPPLPEQVGETRTIRVPGGTIEIGV